MPDVVAREIDVFPAQRRQVGQKPVVNVLTLLAQAADGPFQVHGVPEYDSGYYQIQAAGTATIKASDM